MHIDLLSSTEAATVALGHLIGSSIDAAVLTLDGDLGVGKTHFVTGLAQGLGHGGAVSSPTFALVSEYDEGGARFALYHMDAYRLPDADAFLAAGLDEYFSLGGVCVIEWAELVEDALPEDCIRIRITRLDDLSAGDEVQTPVVADEDGVQQIILPEDHVKRLIRICLPETKVGTRFGETLLDMLRESTIDGIREAYEDEKN